MSGKYILAHDTGTGGDKAVLTDLEGRVVESAYRPYEVYYPRSDWAEQDPDELWQAFAATTREVIAEVRRSTRVRCRESASPRRCSTCCRSTRAAGR